MLFGGCCSNVMTLESIVKIQKNCGYLITLIQFLFISVEGFITSTKFHNPLKEKKFPITMKERKVPLYMWIIMVILFFATSVLNNLVFSYNISIPIHIIFRSSSIITTMLMSWLILKRKYSLQQILSIVIVTIGLIATTLSSSNQKNNKIEEKNTNFENWIKGIFLLVVSSFTGALMGIYQEYVFKKYPNTWKECLFYKHLLSLPIFFFLTPQIKEQWNLFLSSSKNKLGYYIPILPNSISKIEIQWIWYLLIINILTQYICISSVQKLSSICSSVTLNLILNIRKFVSLLISVIYYKNPFSLMSWFGSIFVFIGILMYTKASEISKKKQKESKKTK